MLMLLLSFLLQATAPALRTIDQGPQSQLDMPRQATVRSLAEWQTLWDRHAPGKPLPKVDFAREMIVGVFLGSKPTAGYRVEITSVRSSGDGVVVGYRETQPGGDSIVAEVLTSPYHLVAVPAQTGTVRFEKSGS